MNKNNLYRFLLGLSVAGYLWLGWNFLDQRGGSPAIPGPCLFKQITGIPCPSCGTTRALTAIVDGRLADSLLLNPFGLLVAVAMFIVPLWIITDLLRNTETFYRSYRRGERLFTESGWISASALALVAVNWLWNIVKGV